MNGEYLVVPYAKEVETVTRVLSGMRKAYSSGQKLQDLVCTKTSDDMRRESVIYSIPCGGYSAVYYGETAAGAGRLNGHRSDLRHHRTINSLVLHAEHGHFVALGKRGSPAHKKWKKGKGSWWRPHTLLPPSLPAIESARSAAKLRLMDQLGRSPGIRPHT